MIAKALQITVYRTEDFRATIQFRIGSIHTYNHLCHTLISAHSFQNSFSLPLYLLSKRAMPTSDNLPPFAFQGFQIGIRFLIALLDKMKYVVMLPFLVPSTPTPGFSRQSPTDLMFQLFYGINQLPAGIFRCNPALQILQMSFGESHIHRQFGYKFLIAPTSFYEQFFTPFII